MAIFGVRTGARVRGLGGRPEPVAVLDFGGGTAKCLIGRRSPESGIEVLGFGKAASRGVKAGAVVDMEAAEATVRATVEEAERTAGTPVSAVTVAFCGGQLASHSLYGQTELGEKPADDRDLRRALDSAFLSVQAEGLAGRAMLHRIPLGWAIDGNRDLRDPRGLFGAHLGVDLHVVTAATGPVRNLEVCLERARLGLRGVTATPYAAGLATLVEDETDLGVTLIDMGASCTSAAMFINKALMHVDAIPIGGALVTNDLARGLSTPIADAERIKRQFGSLLELGGDDEEVIECPQLGERIYGSATRAFVRKVIRARIIETFEIIRDRLASAGVLRAAGPRVVLTGGASQLEGVGAYAAEILGKRVRVAHPMPLPGLPDGDDGPDMAAAIGLLRYVLEGPREAMSGPPRQVEDMRPRESFAPMKQAVGWLRANF